MYLARKTTLNATMLSPQNFAQRGTRLISTRRKVCTDTYAAQDGFACQTLTAAPLAMGNVVPEKLLDGLLGNLKNDVVDVRSLHQTFGSVGAKHFFSQLSNHGMHKVAMEVATQDTYPSFGYWIKKGATTCWENWSGVADPMHPPQPVSC